MIGIHLFYNSGALQIINWLHKPVSFKTFYCYLVIKNFLKAFLITLVINNYSRFESMT